MGGHPRPYGPIEKLLGLRTLNHANSKPQRHKGGARPFKPFCCINISENSSGQTKTQ